MANPTVPTLSDPAYKRYVADKIRQEQHATDASDDDVIGALKDVQAPGASQEDFEGALHDTYGKDYQPPKPPSALDRVKEFAGNVAHEVGENVSQAIEHPIATAKNIITSTAPAAIGAGVPMIAPAQQAIHTMESLPEIDVADLRRRGYSRQRILHLLEQHSQVEQSLVQDASDMARQGRQAAAGGAGLAASLLAGKLVGGAVAAPLTGEMSLAGEAATGAAAGGTYGGTAAAAEGRPLNEVAQEAASNAIIGGGIGAGTHAVGEMLPKPPAPAEAPEAAPAPAAEPTPAEAAPSQPAEIAPAETSPEGSSPGPEGAPTPETQAEAGAPSAASPTLPKDLAGAKPRFGYGQKNFGLAFEDDLDRAAYITSQATKSARDADYRQWLRDQGMSDEEIDAHGQRVRDAVKDLARTSSPEDGPIPVPSQSRDAMIQRFRELNGDLPPSDTTPEPDEAPRDASALKPSSRVNQVDPRNADLARQIESSPEFLNRLMELDGGKRVTHASTFAEALRQGPMTVDELANWPARKGVSEIDVARARLLRNSWYQKYMDAVQTGDEQAGAVAEAAIRKIEPGFNNLTATPGRATEIQRTMQLNNELPADVAQRPESKVFAFDKALQAKIDDLRSKGVPFEQMKAELDKYADTQRRLLGVKKLGGFFKNIIDRLQIARTFSILTSPITFSVKVLSDGWLYMQRAMERNVTAAALRTSGQSAAADAIVRGTWGTAQGWKAATRAFLEDLTSGEGGKRFADKAAPGKAWNELSGAGKGARLLSPFRWLSAATSFWHAAVYHSEIYTRAIEQATNLGLKGDAFALKINELTQNVPKDWDAEATKIAQYWTAQSDPDKVLSAIQRIQNIPMMRFIIPFSKTPYNLAKIGLARSPLALLNKGTWADLAADSATRANAIGRLSVGMGLVGTGVAMAHFGQVTGAYPTNPEERRLWDIENRRPWSLGIPMPNGGTRWLGYNRIQPLGMFLQMGVAIHEALKENEFDKAATLSDRLVGQLIRGPLDMTFMQDLNSAISAMDDPQHYAKRLEQLTISGFIPNALRDIRQQTDPMRRKPTTITEALEDMVPGLSTKVPLHRDALGQTKEYEPNPVLRETKQVQEGAETPLTRAMRDLAYVPPEPQTKFKDKQGQHAEITGDDKDKYLEDMGKAAKFAMQMVLASPAVKTLDDDQKREAVDHAVKRAQGTVRNAYKALAGLHGQKVQEYAQANIGTMRAKLHDIAAKAEQDFNNATQ